jgi:transposase
MDANTNTPEVILGVDTHLDTHVGVVVDYLGRVLGTLEISTNTIGYQHLLDWASAFGELRRAGIEGTGTYGAGLARYLAGSGITVIEVNRPDRSRRRRRGKNDPTDAENAARAVLSEEASARPKSQSGVVEAMRALGVARRSAVKARTHAVNQLRGLLVSAPEAIRTVLLKPKIEDCIASCAQLSLTFTSPVEMGLNRALRLLAERWKNLTDELKQLDAALEQLAKAAAPRLLEKFGVGPYTAATLLVAAGDNPERLHSEAALAALCGVSPLEASSGKVSRHRLNRGGVRQANNALWTIAMVRMRSDERTKGYVTRRTQEGLSMKEIQRCLKRYIVRELYPLIVADLRNCSEVLT